MSFIDLHCDTLYRAYQLAGEKAQIQDLPDCSVDITRLRKAQQKGQVFAIFLPPQEDFEKEGFGGLDDDAYIAALHRLYARSLRSHPHELQGILSVQDLDRAEGKTFTLLSMEDCRAIEGSLDKLEAFHAMGFRSMGLTWNGSNCLGHPNSRDPAAMAKGLTPFGKEAVEAMQALGMLVDISHLSDGGALDVFDLCKKPVVATHSNARACCPHPRNLSDELLRKLGNAGGVTGLNFCPAFLDPSPGNTQSRIQDMVRHAKHIVKHAGSESLALGSDFDGITGQLEIDSPLAMENLAFALRQAGFSTGQVEQIFFKNALRVLQDCLPSGSGNQGTGTVQ